MRFEFKEWVIPAAVGVISFGTGVAVGSLINRRKSKVEIEEPELDDLIGEHVNQLQFQFDENADKMNSLLQQTDRVVRKFKEDGQDFLNKFATPSQNEISIIAARDHHPSVERENEYEEVGSVFRVEDENWDYDVEVPKRNPKFPYILHRDEFFADEMGFDNQSTLTYYKGDNVLCDETEVPIYNHEKVVGKLEFGKGSGDPNVVYVRNETLEAEYEILLDTGFYQIEVLGGQTEDILKSNDLKHSIYKLRPE